MPDAVGTSVQSDSRSAKRQSGDAEGARVARESASQRAAIQTATQAIVKLRGVEKMYQRGGQQLKVLENLDLDIPEGSFEAIMGPSGSGKSTLLNLIAGLDRPSAGTVEVAGKRIDQLNEEKLAEWRSSSIGFIFQSHNLLPVLTALENVELQLLLTSMPARERKRRAHVALRLVGLEDRLDHYPRELSGGQEQRVAIARAIVHDPSILVADEPTGDLDRRAADDVLDLFEKLTKEMRKTIVMVTHDPIAAERATVIRRLNKGALE